MRRFLILLILVAILAAILIFEGSQLSMNLGAALLVGISIAVVIRLDSWWASIDKN